MAGLGDLLQRITRSLEEASAQRPGDDLRARLGYGTDDEAEDDLAEDAVWEPEPEPARKPGPARPVGTARTPARLRAPAHAAWQAPAAYRTPVPEHAPADRRAPWAAPSPPHAASASLLAERVRERLRTPEALREAFVVKEILDRPLGRRRRRRETP